MSDQDVGKIFGVTGTFRTLPLRAEPTLPGGKIATDTGKNLPVPERTAADLRETGAEPERRQPFDRPRFAL